jgi:AcrR family transcriptional regulator
MPHATFHNLPEEKRQRIMAAALEEFSARGYRQGSVQAIARRAGIAKGSLYQYFKGKKELFLYTCILVLEENCRSVWGFPEPAPLSFFERLETAALASRRYALEHPGAYQLCLSAREGLPPDMQEILRPHLETGGSSGGLASLVRDAWDHREMRDDIREELVVFILGTLLQKFGGYQATLPGSRDGGHTRQFMDLLKTGLAGKSRNRGEGEGEGEGEGRQRGRK